MKFMKLGSKPDCFQSDGSDVRFVDSELPTDVIIHVGSVAFYLHKFPLLSKSNRIQKLVQQASEASSDEIFIHDFPGGPKTFEICAKFCYGVTVTLNACNVVAARCGAEYLEMTEALEKGNLIFKIEVFLNSSLFKSWKDAIVVLQTTQSFLPWSEELEVVRRCIKCIASKISVDPVSVNWSYTYNRGLVASDEIVDAEQWMHVVPRDWWVEDISVLDVDIYKRVINAVNSYGKISSDLIGEALKTFAVRWLPDSYDALVFDGCIEKNRNLLENIVQLLPSTTCSGCSCKFLLKLLKVAVFVGSGEHLKEELMKRISLQLHKASVKDLLIPAKLPEDSVYDTHIVRSLISKYVMLVGSKHDGKLIGRTADCFDEDSFVQKYLLTIGGLVDSYLLEVASDSNLSISSFVDLSNSVPEAARPVHDGLYAAIDVYLKEHPDLVKADKKRICALIDAKKLSTDASLHAAQNDKLPLRLVVQLLCFEQLRTSAPTTDTASRRKTEQNCLMRRSKSQSLPNKKQVSLRIKDDECLDENNSSSSSGSKDKGVPLLLPSRSRRIFDKLWVGKGQGEMNKISKTSGSSQSPTTKAEYSASSSRHRRYSIS